MNSAGAFFVRWRVRLGYPLAIAVLFFARPSPRSILYGALVGLVGLVLRAWAAGYLHKQEVLTVTGPYAYTRNPLYLGSAVLALGVAIATRSWISALLLGVYFSVFYSVVMRREENELRPRHITNFDRYADAVPLFFPRLSPARFSDSGSAAFSLTQYKKNHEWQAAVGFLLLLIVLVLIWRLRAS
jgi:protein-S-isoprenylcysteine O-methyltransferase Ste14